MAKTAKSHTKTTCRPKPRTTTLSIAASRDILSIPPDDLARRVDLALSLITQAAQTLGTLVELDGNDRQHSNGRLRNGETDAITFVLDTADAFPNLFLALAAKDRGKDDSIFETEPTRDDLARRVALARFFEVIDPLAQGVSDTLLALGERVRDIAVPTYAIARIAARVNPAVRGKLTSATTYYQANGSYNAMMGSIAQIRVTAAGRYTASYATCPAGFSTSQ